MNKELKRRSSADLTLMVRYSYSTAHNADYAGLQPVIQRGCYWAH